MDMRDARTTGRILVVDDEPDLVTILTKYFSEAGYAVDAAAHGGDALIAAHGTGRRVVGLESDGTIAAFTQASLRRLGNHGREPGRNVEIIRADHRAWLREQPDSSFDVVLLDPMFRRSGDAASLFDLLRFHAEHAPLDPRTLREAQRVARRGVLLKDAARGEELQRLGVVPRLSRRSAALAFGWAPASP